MSDSNFQSFLSLKNIDLSFGTVKALQHINIDFQSNEIHAIVGEHGAGKTSLANIIAGIESASSGEIYYRESAYKNYSLKAAKAMSISKVSQHLCLFEQFSIGRNILIDTYPFPLKLYNRKKELKKAAHFLRTLNVDLSAGTKVQDLTFSDKVMVDFLKHIYTDPKVLILDETVEHLSNKHLEIVIPLLKEMKNRGALIIFITHRIDDIYELADKVSIIRDGNLLITEDVKSIDKINLIKLAYTRVIKEHSIKHLDPEFYKLLKYNEAILTKLPFSLIVTDSKMSVRLVNEAASKSISPSGKEYINKNLEEFLGNNKHIYTLIYEQIQMKKDGFFFNLKMNTEKGTAYKNISVITLFDGKYYIGNIITIEDVTEYENMRQQLTLSENLSSLGLLAAGVAHEINNPLEIINYYTEHFLLSNPKDKKIQEAVRDIKEEIVTISNIIGNLMTFTENREIEKEVIDINELLSSLIRLMKKTFENKSIQINFDYQKAVLPVKMVKTELKQVILNVFRNSYEALPENGKIYICTKMSSNENGQKEILVSIKDSGPGIDEKIINNIFMPFFSSKKGSKTNMGLGLSIVYNIITKNGGSFKLENIPNGGCEALISLPSYSN